MDSPLLDQMSSLFQTLDNGLISIFYELPLVFRNFTGESSITIYRAYKRDTCFLTSKKIRFAKSGRRMNDTCSFLCCDKIRFYYAESTFFVKLLKIRKRGTYLLPTNSFPCIFFTITYSSGSFNMR